MPTIDLGGKSAVVTGASSGIGAQVAREVAKAGARVVLGGRDHDRLDRVASTVRAAGGECVPVSVDLTSEGGPEELVDQAVDAFGALDILIQSAGIYDPSPIATSSLERLDRLWNINVRAPFAVISAAVPHMRRGGAIVSISSISGHVGFANEAAYAATKGALDALTRALASELAASGIRVNGVAPGLTITPINEEIRKDKEIMLLAKSSTLNGRLGTVDDIAASVLFLASDAASHIYGVTLAVDGGYPVATIQKGLVVEETG